MSIGTETWDCTGTKKLVSLASIHFVVARLLVWTFVVAGCGISINFWSITVCRMLVGVGEASFISLATPFIDDNAPRTAWLGTDKAKIPRKRLKPGKLEHGNGRARKKPGGSYQNQTLVKP
ncbi:probable sphingolipid transporter spinster homolog 2, partial [Tanacetum coccineum]